MAEQKPKKKTLRDLLRLVFRRRWVFLVGASSVTFCVLIYYHFVPVRFTSSAVFERREDEVSPVANKSADRSLSLLKRMLRYELAGQAAIDRVCEDLGLTEGVPRGTDGKYTAEGLMQKQALVSRVQKSTNVNWHISSQQIDLITVTYTDTDADMAQKLPNRLIKNYIDRISLQVQERLSSARVYLEARAMEAGRLVKEATDAKVRFEQKYVGRMPDTIGGFTMRISQVEADIDTVRVGLETAKQHRARLMEMLKGAAQTTQPAETVMVPNPKRKELEDQLEKVREQLRNEKKYNKRKDAHPVIKSLKESIVYLQDKIAETPEEIEQEDDAEGPDKEAIKVALAAAESKIEVFETETQRLEKRRAELEEVLKNFAPIRREYEEIVSRRGSQQHELNAWTAKLKDVGQALAQEVSKRRMHWKQVELAQKQYRPSSPKLSKVIAFAVVGGLAFGAGLVFLAHLLDRSVATTQDASYFDIPVHGVIGEIITPREQRMRRLKRWIATPIVSLIILACLGLSSLSITLWLRYPERFNDWKASPTTYLYKQVIGPVENLLDSI